MVPFNRAIFRGEPTFDYLEVVFIGHGEETPIDTTCHPFLYNDNGRSLHLAAPRGTLITRAEEAPALRRGTRYCGVASARRHIASDPDYDITQFDFGAESVVYEPLWATRETAQAFGITLVQDGECIAFEHEKLVTCQYVYGKLAGYQSPYIGADRNRELLAKNPTDLEYHAFPHLFCSQDDLPLVISVARYREEEREIWLADLWVKPGDILYVPPKRYSAEYLDLHGDRNSAHACRSIAGRANLVTESTLGNAEVFADPETGPRWFEEKTATVHGAPPGFP